MNHPYRRSPSAVVTRTSSNGMPRNAGVSLAILRVSRGFLTSFWASSLVRTPATTDSAIRMRPMIGATTRLPTAELQVLHGLLARAHRDFDLVAGCSELLEERRIGELALLHCRDGAHEVLAGR